jgi:hypothetical protein
MRREGTNVVSGAAGRDAAGARRWRLREARGHMAAASQRERERAEVRLSVA